MVASVKDYSILLRPVITEKSSQSGEITFLVDPRATKSDVRGAIKRIFNVEVRAVRTLTSPGKPKGRGLISGRQGSYKKAFVKLADGQTINVVGE